MRAFDPKPTAGLAVGKKILVVRAGSEHDFDAAFATLVREGVGGLLVAGEPFLISRREQLVALAARHAVPAVYEYRELVVAGGLLSYGPSLPDMYRQAAAGAWAQRRCR